MAEDSESEAELTEIPAQEILDKIQKGEPVKYDHVRIVGDLDLSQLNLSTKNVDRTEYQQKVLELPAECKIVYSSIKITDSEFKGKVNFSNCTLEADIEFWRATFSSYARFGGATFSRDARFKGATFSGYALFEGATFSSYAGFKGATFSGYALFEGATFSSYAGFKGATFRRDARFGGAAAIDHPLLGKCSHGWRPQSGSGSSHPPPRAGP
jgi:uncharacterized protein YjbI with pentapeptide repeats